MGKMEVSSSRRTRSQAAPEWSVGHCLTLVNEMAAIEADCSKSLSSHQKWKIIVDNCNALEVPRNLNQCRRKWELLFLDYEKINQFDSYWTLERPERKQHRLPEDFDYQLFNAIDNYLKIKGGEGDTDSDTEAEAEADADAEAEAEADLIKSLAQLDSRRPRRRIMHTRSSALEPPSVLICGLESMSKKGHNSGVEEPLKICGQETDLKNTARQFSISCALEETPQKILVEEKEETDNVEKNEQLMVEKLSENAQLVISIVKESTDAATVTTCEDSRDELVKRQGDKLIAALEDIITTMNQFFNM